jgi:hypothetical protein
MGLEEIKDLQNALLLGFELSARKAAEAFVDFGSATEKARSVRAVTIR